MARKPMPEIKKCHCGAEGWLVRVAEGLFPSVRCTVPGCWWGPQRKTERAAIVAWNAAPRKGADES